ncbi:MAG: primosomal protein N' [Myxococcaceae bacterium]|nr:primosomal protein N' [Myxococcaceae bacterium]
MSTAAPRASAPRPRAYPDPGPFALVAVCRPVRGEFTYAVPDALRTALTPGLRIRVPFGRAISLGFYLGPASDPGPSVKTRPIEKALDLEPALTPDLVELLRFAARHYRAPLGEVMKAALPPGLSQATDARDAKPDAVLWAKVVPGVTPAMITRAPAQHAAFSYLTAVGGEALVDEVEHAMAGAREHLKKLAKRGLVTLEPRTVVRAVAQGLAQGRPEALTEAQAVAVQELERAVSEGQFAPYLLHGVTGSGKTEVYLRAAEHARALGKGTLILVPEIALTPQLVGRFKSRFGDAVAVLHSALKDSERLRHWQALRSGKVSIAVGVRSGVFAPIPNLGLVVVDEEHDPSFKQEEKLRYHARDLAVVRAQRAKATVVLGSATPSLETLLNTRQGKYRLLTLPTRVDDRPMPGVSLVDLRLERPKDPAARDVEPPILSPPLRAAMRETLEKGQQVILFLNRRGHSTYVLCEVCGQSRRCTDCDVCLTHHLGQRALVCHYCGKRSPLPTTCPECDGPLLTLGVGTEKVEEEVGTTFPGARLARLDRDAVTNNERLTELLAAFARREIDVLIGTQMVAKGHDFPGVTLVCVLLADSALALPDFRAAERTFHLLTQVAGRAGRGKEPGRVLVQSYNPLAEAVARSVGHDFEGFSALELARRKALGWPPWSRLAAVRVEGEDPDLTADVARRLGRAMARALPAASLGVRLLGPAPAPIAKVKGKTRWQLVLKAPTHALMLGPLEAAEALLPELPGSVRAVIDVDPGAML